MVPSSGDVWMDWRSCMKNRNAYFPLFIDLSEYKVLVVGAGTIALRRIRILLHFTEKIAVAAPAFHPEIEQLIAEGRVRAAGKRFEENMLQGVRMVLACTDDHSCNAEICQKARRRGILANNCSSQEDCDFFFPSIVKQGDLVIGINAGGTHHKKVKQTREKIEQVIGGNDADYNRNQGEPSGSGTK